MADHASSTTQQNMTSPPLGTSVTDHMIKADWDHVLGWSDYQLEPYSSLSLDPASCVLQYSSSCFESMKAFRGNDGIIRLFRPELYTARFRRSASRMGLPLIDEELLLQMIWDLVQVDQKFVPSIRGYSLSIRPTMIATNVDLSISKPTSALCYIIASSVGPYYSEGLKAINLETVPGILDWNQCIRSYKIGANYGPTFVATHWARENGSDGVIHTIGDEGYITGVSTMNFFVVVKSHSSANPELITPPLGVAVFPGVIRDSVLQLARERLLASESDVVERSITLEDLRQASIRGLLLEAFGTGTAGVVYPIRNIWWGGRSPENLIYCGLREKQEAGEVATVMKRWIEELQYGDEEHEWAVKLESSSQEVGASYQEVGIGCSIFP